MNGGRRFLLGAGMLYRTWAVKALGSAGLPYPYIWANCYGIDAANNAQAASRLTDLMDIERTVHHARIIYLQGRYVISPGAASDGDAVSYFHPGLRGDNTEFGQSVWWAMIVNWFNDGRWIGRSWLRLGLRVADTVAGLVDPSIVSLVETSYIAPVVGLGYVKTRAALTIDEGRADPRWRRRAIRQGSARRHDSPY